MANTKLLEREIHNLASAKARRMTMYLAVGGETSADSIDAVCGEAAAATRSAARKGCKFVRCALSGAGSGALAFDLVYDDKTRDNDIASPSNRSAILRVAYRERSARQAETRPRLRPAAGAVALLMARLLARSSAASKRACRSPPSTKSAAAIGKEIGVSSWITVDQARIDAFADATEDRQFIHVDPDAAAQTPFGGTIAHGFLSLSLLSRMGGRGDARSRQASKMAINYGLDHVRFLAPVTSGKRVRGRFTLDSVEEKAPGQLLLRHSVTVEIEGEDKPALTANWLGLMFV